MFRSFWGCWINPETGHGWIGPDHVKSDDISWTFWLGARPQAESKQAN
jgi:hypothetical protein